MLQEFLSVSNNRNYFITIWHGGGRSGAFWGVTTRVDAVLLLQSGETALHVAARYGNVDVVQYLCSIHANPDLSDRVRVHAPHTHRPVRAYVLSLYWILYCIILDSHGKRLSVKKTQQRCSSWHSPGAPGTYYHTPFWDSFLVHSYIINPCLSCLKA